MAETTNTIPTSYGLNSGLAQTFNLELGDRPNYAPYEKATQEGIDTLVSTLKERKAAKAEVAKKANDLIKGDFNYTKTLLEDEDLDVKKFVDREAWAGKSAEEVNNEIDEVLAKRQEVLKIEKIYKSQLEQAAKNPNSRVYNEQTGKYENAYEYYARKLIEPASKEDLELMRNGELIPFLNTELLEDNSRSAVIDPNYSLDADVLKMAEAYFKGTDVISNIEGVRRITTTTENKEQVQKFTASLLDNPPVYSKWATQRMIKENIPPSQALQYMQNPETKQAYADELKFSLNFAQRGTKKDEELIPAGTGSGSGGSGGKVEEIPVFDKSGVAIATTVAGRGLYGTTFYEGKVFSTPQQNIIVGDGETVTVSGVIKDKNQEYVGVDADGQVVLTPTQTKTYLATLRENLSEGELKRFDTQFEFYKEQAQPATELKLDRRAVESTAKKLTNAAESTDDLKNFLNQASGSGISEERLTNFYYPALKEGVVTYKDPSSGETIVVPNTSTYTDNIPEEAETRKVAPKEFKLFGDSESSTAMFSNKPNSSEIRSLLFDNIISENPNSYIDLYSLGKSTDPAKVGAYLNKSKRDLLPDERYTLLSLVSEQGMEIGKAMDYYSAVLKYANAKQITPAKAIAQLDDAGKLK